MRTAIKPMPNITDERYDRLMTLVGIVDRYGASGQTMTVRQLYYRMVAEGHLDSGESEYGKVQRDAKMARYTGLIGFDDIEDRTRNPDSKKTYEDLEELTRVAKRLYVLDRWTGQDYHVELWCEKEALSGVLRPVARKWQVTYSTCRGYTSASAMYSAAQRMQKHEVRGKQNIILYVGDHDPSGLDMQRDLRSRFLDFSYFCDEPTVQRIALTKEQIKAQDLRTLARKVGPGVFVEMDLLEG